MRSGRASVYPATASTSDNNRPDEMACRVTSLMRWGSRAPLAWAMRLMPPAAMEISSHEHEHTNGAAHADGRNGDRTQAPNHKDIDDVDKALQQIGQDHRERQAPYLTYKGPPLCPRGSMDRRRRLTQSLPKPAPSSSSSDLENLRNLILASGVAAGTGLQCAMANGLMAKC